MTLNIISSGYNRIENKTFLKISKKEAMAGYEKAVNIMKSPMTNKQKIGALMYVRLVAFQLIYTGMYKLSKNLQDGMEDMAAN